MLDNFETPWEFAEEKTADLLDRLVAIPKLIFAVSFRGADKVAPKIPWNRIHIAPLDPEISEKAFCAYADIEPSSASPIPSFKSLLEESGGIPLVFEQMAISLPDDPIDSDFGALLTEWKSGELAEMAPIDRALNISWQSQRLTEPARSAARILALLPDGLAPQDHGVLSPNGLRGRERLLLKRRLAFRDESLRLRMRPPIRSWVARTQAAKPVEFKQITQYVIELAESTSEIRRDGEIIQRLASEVGNIAAYFELLFEDLPRVSFISQLKLANSIPQLAEAMLVSGIKLRHILVRSAEVFRLWTLPLQAANCGEALAAIELRVGDSSAAAVGFEKARRIFKDADSHLGQGKCAKGMAAIALRSGDIEGAKLNYEEALIFFERAESYIGMGNCTKGLADVALRIGDNTGAKADYQKALGFFKRIDSSLGQGRCLKGLADIALRIGNCQEAKLGYEKAFRLFKKDDYPLGQGNCTKGLARIALWAGDISEAKSLYKRALGFFQKANAPIGQGNCTKGLADIWLRLGNDSLAKKSYQKAINLAQRARVERNIEIGKMGFFWLQFFQKSHRELSKKNEISLRSVVGDYCEEIRWLRSNLHNFTKSLPDLEQEMEWSFKVLERYGNPKEMEGSVLRIALASGSGPTRERWIAIADHIVGN